MIGLENTIVEGTSNRPLSPQKSKKRIPVKHYHILLGSIIPGVFNHTCLTSIASTIPSIGEDPTVIFILSPRLKGFSSTSIIPERKLDMISFNANPTVKPVIPIPVTRGVVSTPIVPSAVTVAKAYAETAAALDMNRAKSVSLTKPDDVSTDSMGWARSTKRLKR